MFACALLTHGAVKFPISGVYRNNSARASYSASNKQNTYIRIYICMYVAALVRYRCEVELRMYNVNVLYLFKANVHM